MKNKILKSVLLMISLFTLVSFTSSTDWFKGGTNQDDYTVGIDNTTSRNSNSVYTIKSFVKEARGFGTYVSEMPATRFAGKKLRMTGYVKTNEAKTLGGFLIITDGSFPASDKMKVTNNDDDKKQTIWSPEWIKTELEVEIPADAINIQYGVLLEGNGQIWFDEISFEIIDKLNVPTEKH